MTYYSCNYNPVARDDVATTGYNASVIINVLANDFDLDCDRLSIYGTPTVAHGTVTVNADGTLTFLPEPGFSGMASICYTVSDGRGGFDTATVSIKVSEPARDYIVEGTSGNDLIDYAYTGDPEHDRIDQNDNATCTNDDVVKAGAGDDTILSGAGNDTVYAEDGNDVIDGGIGNDNLFGGTGDDTFIGGAGNDTFTGDAGLDIIDYSASSSAVNVNLASGALSGGDAGGDVIANGIDGIIGTSYNDTLVGFDQEGTDPADTYTNVFHGMGGNDSIVGAGGADSLFGGAGDDTILGGAGDDLIHGDGVLEDASGLQNVDPVALDFGAARPGSETSAPNAAVPGSSVIYDNVATLEDGTQVSARLVLVATSSSSLQIDMASSNDCEILLNANNNNAMVGQTATFRLEFFDTLSGAPVTFEPGIVFGDLDQNTTSEIITINDPNLLNVGLPANSSLTTNFTPGALSVGGTQDNIDANDPDAQIATIFGPTSSVTFTMTSREWNSGLNFGTLSGNSFHYVIEPERGNDLLEGGEGNDTIWGQGGDDTLSGGTGADSLLGGDDRDTFTVPTAAAGIGDVIDGGEGGDDIDTLNLTGAGPLRVVYDSSNSENGIVNFLDGAGNITGSLSFLNIENVIPCFTPGTLVATPKGERLVEELREGDKVLTRDNGIQEIRWVGRRDLTRTDLMAAPHLKPVLIKAGCLGKGLPERDMMVSPNHRMLVTNERTALYFEEHEVLVAAKHLIDNRGVKTVETLGTSYLHFLCDRHEVVLANGAWTESFQPGDQTLGGMGNAQRSEIFEIFPDLQTRSGIDDFAAARKTLKKHEAALLRG